MGAFVLDAQVGTEPGLRHVSRQVRRVEVSDGVARRRLAPRRRGRARTRCRGSNSTCTQRFFAWLHFYDAHTPYDPPGTLHARAFADRPYAGEIAYIDFQIGRLLQWLDTKGIADRTIVIAIGDHGESLNEHGEATHGLFIYDATMRVPFIIRAPYDSMRGRRVSGTVRTRGRDADGARSGRQACAGQRAGTQPGAADDRRRRRHWSSTRTANRCTRGNHFGWSELKSLRSGRFKYISATRPELYDLERDPSEKQNLYDERRQLADRMAAELTRLASEESSHARAVRRRSRNARAACGARLHRIVQRQAPRQAGEVLPDPKDKIDIFNLMTAAREAGEGDDATLNRLLKVVVAGSERARCVGHARQRVLPQARISQRRSDNYKRALQINPGYNLAIVDLAGAYQAMGDYDAAMSATNATWRRIRRMRGSGISSASSTSISDSSRKRNARSSSR